MSFITSKNSGGTAFATPLDDSQTNSPDAVTGFTIYELGQTAEASVYAYLTEGDTATFYGYVYSEFYGISNNAAIPIPPSALLLGSGLLGLVFLGRRKIGLKK